ncbi:MAG: Serine/threonine-protein phosphatase 2A activator 1 [Stictis urceolatum]|nr:Serine/threonine-protein phosphatase 2A activator 1 [Stictis urceolata]
MFPLSLPSPNRGEEIVKTFEINNPRQRFSQTVVQLQELLSALDSINDEVELDTGPRRFGNVSFRKWCNLLEERSTDLLRKHLSTDVARVKSDSAVGPSDELRAYLIGSFGSSQRLDYGTGHELSFLAFLGCLWKLGAFGSPPSENDMREIVIGVLHAYLTLIRKLILKYTLEPAGTHGVWGLDDHSFLPYIFGSAQYGPAIKPVDPVPTEGSLKGATDPGNVAKTKVVEQERHRNLYFEAIGFIYDVKKGPFWEHSPTLYDISGVRAGWAKINKGMLKMYDAEVLGKFPVVQHFPFGSLFSFDRDQHAEAPVATAHTANQPMRQTPAGLTITQSSYSTMKAPWAATHSTSSSQTTANSTSAPWASRKSPLVADNQPDSSKSTSTTSTDASLSKGQLRNAGLPPPTKAPWAQ